MVNKIEKAYIAGLIDGEGCIFLGRRFDKRNGRNRMYYKLEVILVMSNPNAIIFVKERYGGALDKQKNGVNKSLYWRLNIASIKALNLLKDILPYLRIKKASAMYAIQFQEHIEVNRHESCVQRGLKNRLFIDNLTEFSDPQR